MIAKRKFILIFIIVILLFTSLILVIILRNKYMLTPKISHNSEIIQLPPPRFESEISIEEALLKRRSVREYKDEPLTLVEVSQLLWAAQGITDQEEGKRTTPSAGALYPLEVYLVAGKVDGLASGVYRYQPLEHGLIKIKEGDRREELAKVALGQEAIKEASIVLVLAAVYERTTVKYGERGIKYVHLEAGHAAQNIYLQAVSLNLGTVTIGAFSDQEVKELLDLPKEEQPLYLMPVGKK